MYKILTILGFLTFSLSFTDATLDACKFKTCETPVCPKGQYLTPERDDDCCQRCIPYAKLGEQCDFRTQPCDPYLYCPLFGVNPLVCMYSWENQFTGYGCRSTLCPRYKECPSGSFLVEADFETRCCDVCIAYSTLGHYCDEKQQCASGLRCIDNMCNESEDCALESDSCEPVTAENCLLNNSYRMERDGVQQCCDICQPYAKLNETCNDTLACESGLVCHYGLQTCMQVELDCDLINCQPEEELECLEGVVVPKQTTGNCCAYCKLFGTFGHYCNDDMPCMSKFVCKNDMCDVPKCECTNDVL